MADDEKNAEKNEPVENEQVSDTTPVADTSSTDEQTPATAEVSDTSAQTPEAETTAAEEVSDTSAPTAAQETAAAGAEDDVSDTAADASGAATAEVSDTSATADAGATATEAVSDTSAKADAGATGGQEVSDTAPATVEKKPRSNRHVPRTQRRTRTKPAREKPAARKPITRTPKPESELGRRQERRGVVISDKGDKTIVVKVDVIKSHPRYKKVVRRAVKFHAHDEQNTAGIGDTVRIIETRPLSRTKRWRLAEIVEKAR